MTPDSAGEPQSASGGASGADRQPDNARPMTSAVHQMVATRLIAAPEEAA